MILRRPFAISWLVLACLGLPARAGELSPAFRVVTEPEVRSPEPDAATCRPCGQSDLPITFTPAWQSVSGRLDGRNSCRIFAADVVAGTEYTLSTCSSDPSGFASFDSILQVVDPLAACIVVASNDDACGTGGASRLTFVAPFTGIVHVRLAGFAGSGGSFSLAYRSEGTACPSPCPGRPMFQVEGCGCVRGELSPSCPVQSAWGRLTAGRPFTATTCGSSWCGTGSGGPDVELRLLQADCLAVVAVGTPDCAGTGTTLTYTPASTGDYRLEIRNAGPAPVEFTTCQTHLDAGVPWPQFLTPRQGAAGMLRCEPTRLEAFTISVQPGADTPVSYAWTIHPPSGAVAVPSSGDVVASGPGAPAAFVSTLSGLGIYRIEMTATNATGAGTWMHSYELADRTPPLILAPPSQVIECPAVPGPATPRVRDNCDASPDVSLGEIVEPGPCPNAFTLRRTWTAMDDAFNRSTATQLVRVVDRRPPVITPDTSVHHCAYPPDHGRACFTFADFTPIAADACPGPISWRFVRVTHDEAAMGACDPPDREPDVEIAADGTSFCVRAERCVDDDTISPGRTYLVEVVAVDACGNSSTLTPIGAVLVPQDSADTTACRSPAPWD